MTSNSNDLPTVTQIRDVVCNALLGGQSRRGQGFYIDETDKRDGGSFMFYASGETDGGVPFGFTVTIDDVEAL